MDFQIIALNDGATRLMGLPRDALQWKRLAETNLWSEQFGIRESLSVALATGARKSFETTYRPMADCAISGSAWCRSAICFQSR